MRPEPGARRVFDGKGDRGIMQISGRCRRGIVLTSSSWGRSPRWRIRWLLRFAFRGPKTRNARSAAILAVVLLAAPSCLLKGAEPKSDQSLTRFRGPVALVPVDDGKTLLVANRRA